jgi:hypothetical protein
LHLPIVSSFHWRIVAKNGLADGSAVAYGWLHDRYHKVIALNVGTTGDDCGETAARQTFGGGVATDAEYGGEEMRQENRCDESGQGDPQDANAEPAQSASRRGSA